MIYKQNLIRVKYHLNFLIFGAFKFKEFAQNYWTFFDCCFWMKVYPTLEKLPLANFSAEMEIDQMGKCIFGIFLVPLNLRILSKSIGHTFVCCYHR
jgi:hypothetical protein